MEAFSCFTVNRFEISRGIELGMFDASNTKDLCELGCVAAYPLYPRKQFSAKAQTMLPFSLSYVTKAPYGAEVSQQGVLLAVDASQWLPLDAYTDNSFLIDVSGTKILLYCPVGQTFLRSKNKKDPRLLQISQKCQPQITQQTNVKLDMTSLGNGFVTPVFNSEATALLDKKLRCKASAKRPKNAPVEAALGTAVQSSSGDGKSKKQEEGSKNS